MNKELLRDAVSVMETWWARFPRDMSASDRDVVNRMQAEIDAPEQEPVKWEHRWTNPDGYSSIPTDMIEWRPVDLQKDKPEDLLGYRFKGKPCYEVRGLYAKPQPVAFLPGEYERMTERGAKAWAEPIADLTDAEIEDVYRHIPDSHQWVFSGAMMKFGRAVLAAQKGKT